jgi:hypothetical protein
VLKNISKTLNRVVEVTTKNKRRYREMSKKILVLIALTFILGFAGSVLAEQAALDTFNNHYNKSYGCNLCHTANPPARNPYGADLTLPVTVQKLTAIEGIDSDGDGATNIEEINANKFPGNPASKPRPKITITAPIAAQGIPSGGLFTILYDAPSEVISIGVRYSLDDGATWFPADGTPDVVAGSFDWNVPTPVKNSTKALVKVTGFDALDARAAVGTSARFTIEVVSITTPAPAEIVPGGISYLVNWTTNGTKAPVSGATVFYTFGSSGIWKEAAGTPGLDPLTSFNWTVPSPARGKNAKLRVVLKDDLGATVGRAISQTFRVQ